MNDHRRPQTIVAVVNETGSEAVRRRAVELAQEANAHLILWDAEAGERLLEDPLPNQWSADGAEEQFGDRLTISDLEAAGRAPLARQVVAAQAAGVATWAWLPSDQDPDTLRAYLDSQGADVVVVAADSGLAEGLEDEGVRVEAVSPAA